MAVGIDAPPYIVFWNPYTRTSPYTLPFPKTHSGIVRALKCTENNMLISVSNDTYVKNWNYADATNIWDIKMSNEQTAMELLNNATLVVGSISGSLSACDLSSGNCQQPVIIHGATINAFEVLENGDLVSGTTGGIIRVWTPGSYGQSIWKFGIDTSNVVKSLKRLPNGYLACGLGGGLIKIYNMSNQSLVLEFKAHLSMVTSLEILENGDLASASRDKTIKIWNGTNFKLKGELNYHTGSVNALKLLSSSLLASGSDDYTIKVWNTSSMTKVNEVNFDHPVKALELLRNDTFFNSTPISIVRTGLEFYFSQLTISEQTQLLDSKYDLSGCIVNCTNRGYCVFDLVSDSFRCACKEFYTGKACKTDLRACSSSPCLNNATCVENNTLAFNCECEMGYEGVYCENKINICANETCSNNGICEDLNNLPKCKCFSMYEGDRCDKESSQLRTIKFIISMSSIIAIFAIICFYLVILIMDFLKYCLMVKPKRRKRPVYTKYVN